MSASSATSRDLFISHSAADVSTARALRTALEPAGYSCWIAPDDVGARPWTEEILTAIDGCQAMLVLVSVAANRSAHVAREVGLAVGRGRPVVPVRIEPVAPGGSLEYLLALVQRVDAFPPPITGHVDLVLGRIRTVLAAAGSVGEPTRVAAETRTDTRVEPRISVPASLTRLVGRDHELAEVERLLAEHRLVTLTGPGGVGKTRLATEVAWRVGPGFPDGVHFVDLAGLSDATLLPRAIAEALDLDLDAAPNPEQALLDGLGRRRVLLVLDNMEQVAEGAGVVGSLLRNLPGLRIVATSRVPLWVRGEMEIAIDPLPLPDPQASLDELRANDSAVLLVDHLRRHRAAALTEENRAEIIDICRRLDGLPLALELVAAQARGHSLATVRERLVHRLDIAAPEVDVPDRQRTLRATIAWSTERLSAEGRELFTRLGVYAGGFTVEAAAAVVDAGVDVDSSVNELVRASLARHMTSDAVAGDRYVMLETIREYASEELSRSKTAHEIRRRAIEWLIVVLQQSEAQFERAEDQAGAVERAEAERTNVRALLEWAAQAGEDEAALRLAASRRFWAMRGSAVEGRAWLRALLDRPVEYPQRVIAQARSVLASLSLWVGDLVGARREWEAAQVIWASLGERRRVAVTENNLGIVAERQDDLDAARTHGARALEIMRDLEDDAGIAAGIGNLGILALRQGDLDAATRYNEEALDRGRTIGHTEWISIATSNLGAIAVKRGDIGLARELLREAIALNRELSDVVGTISTLESFAELAGTLGDLKKLVRLHGGIDRLRAAVEISRSASELAAIEVILRRARQELGDFEYEASWARGAQLDLEALVREALETAAAEDGKRAAETVPPLASRPEVGDGAL